MPTEIKTALKQLIIKFLYSLDFKVSHVILAFSFTNSLIRLQNSHLFIFEHHNYMQKSAIS